MPGRRLWMIAFVSLDGVMQAPGGPHEDRSGGFERGGWMVPFIDDDLAARMVEWFAQAGAFVLGRKTYEIFAAHWPGVESDDPVSRALNEHPKHVASRTLSELEWAHSSLLGDDVASALSVLKEQPGGDLIV